MGSEGFCPRSFSRLLPGSIWATATEATRRFFTVTTKELLRSLQMGNRRSLFSTG